MDKMEKISKLDLSPHVFWITQGTLSENAKLTIENLRLRYEYKGNLFQFLVTLPSWINSYYDIQRQNGRRGMSMQDSHRASKSAASCIA